MVKKQTVVSNYDIDESFLDLDINKTISPWWILEGRTMVKPDYPLRFLLSIFEDITFLIPCPHSRSLLPSLDFLRMYPILTNKEIIS
jgi:hypothetical protein